MRTKIAWAELHSPIFLGGTNLSAKLDPSKRQGLVMEYDEDRKQMYITYNGKTARIPEPSILSMVEGSQPEVKPVAQAAQPNRKIVAQVSTPQDHVFKGEGHGKDGVQEALRRL